jgi:hypothetical protein
MKHFQAYAAFGMVALASVALVIVSVYVIYRIGELIR